MSKASDYAMAVSSAANARPDEFKGHHDDGESFYFSVSDEGNLRTCGAVIEPSEAIRLAHWLLDTFGDGEHRCEEHRCDLPDSIKEALNSGDGTYRP